MITNHRPMTARQQELLNFLASYGAENKRPPTLKEIADHFNWASLTGVRQHLHVLEAKGKIELSRGARGIKIVED